MRYLVIKDKKKRQAFHKNELKAIYLKSMLLEESVLKDEQLSLNLFKKLNKVSNYSRHIKAKNRCVISFRSKSVYRDVKLSRIMFRNLYSLGELNGVRKSSW